MRTLSHVPTFQNACKSYRLSFWAERRGGGPRFSQKQTCVCVCGVCGVCVCVCVCVKLHAHLSISKLMTAYIP